MRKLETLFKEFINAPIQIYSGATFKKGLYDLLEVYDNTVSGDLVVVKGNHDIVNNSIQLKNGVNWEFKGYPIISSDSANGTFIDSNAIVDVHFSGDLIIENTNGIDKLIVLQQSSSSIKGFVWTYRALLTNTDGSTVVPVVLQDDLGYGSSWGKLDSGMYYIDSPKAFNLSKSMLSAKCDTSQFSQECHHAESSSEDGWAINLFTYKIPPEFGVADTMANTFYRILVELVIYP